MNQFLESNYCKTSSDLLDNFKVKRKLGKENININTTVEYIEHQILSPLLVKDIRIIKRIRYTQNHCLAGF